MGISSLTRKLRLCTENTKIKCTTARNLQECQCIKPFMCLSKIERRKGRENLMKFRERAKLKLNPPNPAYQENKKIKVLTSKKFIYQKRGVLSAKNWTKASKTEEKCWRFGEARLNQLVTNSLLFSRNQKTKVRFPFARMRGTFNHFDSSILTRLKNLEEKRKCRRSMSPAFWTKEIVSSKSHGAIRF